MTIVVLAVHDQKEPWLQHFSKKYSEKLSRFCKFELQFVKPYRLARGENDQKLEKESASLLQKIKPTDYVVVCDEGGAVFESKKFSKKLEQWRDMLGSRRLVFVIGGAYGMTEELKGRAQQKLQLSSLTMNHPLALAVLLEQVYRAWTILSGQPYHNE